MTTWQYDIRADLGWQETAIHQVPDKGVMLEAAGEWKHANDWDAVDAEGHKVSKKPGTMDGAFYRHLAVAGRPEFLHSGTDAYVGSLIGKWGPDGVPFKMGKRRSFMSGSSVDTSKKLYLAMNDREGEEGLKDNSGVMHVIAAVYTRSEREPRWTYSRFGGWSTTTC
ncbi:hypothetical protein AQI88_41130 [Streptomyces cellostaticus]|uniref:Uncharacterized protein n=1 Tax=Streptomyces cellostaticus TaxID=67285 RepID=A0A101N559_9ACTN|nr:hypothetical protein [Streptomyces cellostaticus]KUM86685.1 hypothetical protein AQI88_41130 [Streptomyces cellostaticus]GHI10082.1 hypothetical protein Scel_84030 [Streptomyces cellostaticus]